MNSDHNGPNGNETRIVIAKQRGNGYKTWGGYESLHSFCGSKFKNDDTFYYCNETLATEAIRPGFSSLGILG